MNTKLEKIARVMFYALLALAPLGTRYIGYMGNIGGVDIEAGTVSMFATQILAIAVVILSLVVAINRGKGLPEWKRDPFSVTALLVVLSAYLSAILSLRFTSSLVVASWVALGAALFCSVRIIRPSTGIAALSFMAGGLAQTLLAAIQFTTQEVIANKWFGMASHLPSEPGAFVVGAGDGRWLRAYGTLAHPNILGMYLAMAALLALAFAAGRRGWWRGAAIVSAVPIAFGLVLTFSRSAALGFIVGLATLAVPTFICTGKWKPRLSPSLIAAALGLVAMASAIAALHDPALTRVTAEGRLERISIEERGSQLVDARELFADNSLFGVGPGMMPYAVQAVDPHREPWTYQYVHSAPLLVAVETGFLGVIAWSLLTWFLISVACRTAKHEAGPDWVPFLPLLSVLAMVSLFDHFVWTSWFGQLIFWSVAALTVTTAAPIPRLKKEGGRLVVE